MFEQGSLTPHAETGLGATCYGGEMLEEMLGEAHNVLAPFA